MDLRRLSNFVRIVDAGSMTRAASVIRIAQPALSYQIARLEDELGTRLLVRSARGVRPTDAGSLLYRHARAMLRQFELIPELVKALDREPVGDVRVGLPSILAPVIAAPLAAKVHSLLPRVRLRVLEAESLLQRELISHSRVELGLLYECDRNPQVPRRPLFMQAVYLLEKATTPSAEPLTLAEALTGPLVLPTSPNPTRAVFDRALQRAGLVAQVAAEMNSAPMLISAVRSGIGSAIMAWTPLKEFGAAADLRFRRIVRPRLELQVSLYEASQVPVSGAALAVQAILTDLVLERIGVGDWHGAKRLAEFGG